MSDMGLSYPYFCEFLDAACARYTESALRRALPGEPELVMPAAESFGGGLNYLLCYVPRSGSTHLTSLLRGTAKLGKPADFLNLEYHRLAADRQDVFEETGLHTICEARTAYGAATVGEYLAHLTRVGRTPNGVFGMKADLYQASILMRRGLFLGGPLTWKYIYLTRQDLLLQAISLHRAIQTDVWSTASGPPKAACVYDPAAILAQVRALAGVMAQWEFVFAGLGIAPLRVTYEDLEADPRNVLARIASYLGIGDQLPELPVRSSYGRQRTAENERWAALVRAAAQLPGHAG